MGEDDGDHRPQGQELLPRHLEPPRALRGVGLGLRAGDLRALEALDRLVARSPRGVVAVEERREAGGGGHGARDLTDPGRVEREENPRRRRRATRATVPSTTIDRSGAVEEATGWSRARRSARAVGKRA